MVAEIAGKKKHKKADASRIFLHVFLVILCLLIVSSFLLVIGASLQSETEIRKFGYRLFPKKICLDAYKMVFNNPTSILKSYQVTILTTVIGMFLGTLFTAGYGYALSRKDFAYRKILNWLNIISMLFNGGLVATYIVMTQWFNLKNNIGVLIWPVIFSPWNVIMMKSFFSSLPFSIIEAAKVDGASEFRIFFKIVIPMSKPIVATIALFLTLTLWNDYQQSLLYITNENLYKLQYLLMKIFNDINFMNTTALEMGVNNIDNVTFPTSGLRMAMCVIVAGPILFVFPFFQKYFAKGIYLGGVKE